MRILVMGAGALGGYFGARLQAADHDVTYVARGAHLEAMQANGLRVESSLGDIDLPKVHAIADPAEAPTADIVMFMVKNRDVEGAAAQLAPALGPETIVVTCQNGVSAPERLAAVIGKDRVHPGAVYMPADIKEPGVIRHPANFHRLVFGALNGRLSPTGSAFAEAVRASGPECEIASDARALLWNKFVLLSSFSAITTLTRLDIGPIRDTPATWALVEQLVLEAMTVGRAECPTISPDADTDALHTMRDIMGPGLHASMLDDLNRGKPIELNYLSGEILRLGQVHGIDTPAHAFVTSALQPYVDGGR